MKIDLRKINTYIINLEKDHERRCRIIEQVKKFDLDYTLVNGEYCAEGIIGCGISHLKILHQDLEVPFLLLEDDTVFTDDFTPILEFPKETDAVYLGVSRFGIDWSKSEWASWDGTEATDYNADYLRVHNMVGAHAVLYISAKYKQNAYEAGLARVLDRRNFMPVTIGYADIQNANLVLTPRKFMAYQSKEVKGKEASTKISLKPVETVKKASDGYYYKEIQTDKIEDRDDYECWVFTIKNRNGEEVYRDDILDSRILFKHSNKVIIRRGNLVGTDPATYRITPVLMDGTFLPSVEYEY